MQNDESLGTHQFNSLLTVGECARLAGVGRQAVAKWIRTGKVRAIQQPGNGVWFVPQEDLEQLIAKRQSKKDQ